MLSDYCIYTIRHSKDLSKALEDKGGRGKFQESKRWVQAERLLSEAKAQDKRLPIVFAPAEGTAHLFGWGLVERITLDEHDTVYEFSALRKFASPQPRKSSLRKKSNGQPLHERFIRPYAICRTPDDLKG